MFLESLQLVDFRNFARLQVSLRPQLNFFHGDNGQGKTNFLEAVHLLSRGSSFRPVDSRNFLRRGGIGRSKISGRIRSSHFEHSIEMTIEANRKSMVINGKRVTSTESIRVFPTVLFSPESLASIKEGPDQRRQLVDDLLLSHDPRQAQLLKEYSRALRSRNRLLKNLSENVGHRTETLDALESLNKIYFVLSAHVAAARTQVLRKIQPRLRDAMQFIAPDSAGDITVDYQISDQSALEWSESQVYDAIRNRALELASREHAYGGSLVGPHKHEIRFLFAGNDSRFYCSQGQQRALILALKIAQIVYHHEVRQKYPVLLLDDVLSELDAKKRANLMKFLEGISAQILITSTDLTWSEQFAYDRNSVFSVTQGQVALAT